MGKYKNYTDEEFIEAWNNSKSKRQVMIKLNLAPVGGNYRTVTRKAERLGLSSEHMTGKGWNLGNSAIVVDIAEYLNNKKPILSYALKKRLFKEKILEEKCSNCGITEWMGQPAPLELDHIDGNNSNNSLDNLRILCPNCHAQTDTYRGKNKTKRSDATLMLEEDEHQDHNQETGITIEVVNPKQKSTYVQPTKIDWPSDDELIDGIRSSSFLALSRELGVSDNAIRHRLKNRGKLDEV